MAKIHEVSFYSLTTSTWDDLASAADLIPSPGPDSVDMIMRSEGYTSQGQAQNQQGQVFEHPCAPLTKILSSGSFYYALEPHWDLSTRLGTRLANGGGGGIQKKDLGAFDERFIWNEYIVRSMLDFRERLELQERGDLDRCQFIVRTLSIQHF